MLIICPKCATSYTVDPDRLPASREVRCGRCRTVWQAPARTLSFPVGALSAIAESAAPPATDVAEALAAEPPTLGLMALREAPPLAPDRSDLDEPDLEPPAPTPALDVETAARRRTPRPAPRRPRQAAAGAMLLLLALAGANAALLVWRDAVARHLPQTARLYAAIGLPVNLRGVAFADVRTTTELQDGQPIVAVEGVIANVSPRPVEVPRLRFAVRDGDARELYAWTSLPARTVLPAGETLPFRSRLTAPPEAGKEIAVRFLTPGDLAGGSP